MIGFNKPYLTGKELEYIANAVENRHISGNGQYTKLCHHFFEARYGFNKCLLTTSCTDALEMAAILCDIKQGDEVIIPSFTFVSTALSFVRQGAKIVFADSHSDHPNIDENALESLITPNTKVIVVVHYAGVACHMDKIMALADKYKLFVIEDAAQALDSYFSPQHFDKLSVRGEKPLGSIGHLACFSFHETKNIQCGEGGMLVINDERFVKRAEIIWEKGTNRAAFWRGEIDKYGWVDTGSSFLPSDLLAAFLFAQLENLEIIQNKRKYIWDTYWNAFKKLNNNDIILPSIPDYATNNAHMFYIVCKSASERQKFIEHLKENKVNAVFHYQSLHKSLFYKNKHDGRELPNADKYTDCLLRLPLFYELTDEQINKVINLTKEFFG